MALRDAAYAPSHLGRTDIVENSDGFIFTIDTPGMTKRDLKVKVKDRVLHVSGDRKFETGYAESKYLMSERSHGKFSRSFIIPDGCDTKNTNAYCDNGVLVVVVPKADPSSLESEIVIQCGSEEGTGELNAEFQAIPISIFPLPAIGQVVIIDSNTSIIEAVKTLSHYQILSAPVRDVSKPADSGWTEKYLGMVDMVGIVFHMLDILGNPQDFETEMEKTQLFHKTTVAEVTGFAKLGPFVPVEYDSGNLLDAMLLCGQHSLRRVPVVKSPGGDLVNIITQSALIQTLYANLDRFSTVANKCLLELGLGGPANVFKVTNDDTLRAAFNIIREKNVSAVPVVDSKTGRVVGNISARDARYIVGSNKIIKLLSMPIRDYLEIVTEKQDSSAITCSPKDSLRSVIQSLVKSRIHRIYLCKSDGVPIRVISLRDILVKFTKEPEGYFGHYFLY